MGSLSTTIGERVRTARIAAGLSQTMLAARIRCRPAQVGHWETGHQAPSAARLRQLSVTLGVSADYLLGIKERP